MFFKSTYYLVKCRIPIVVTKRTSTLDGLIYVFLYMYYRLFNNHFLSVVDVYSLCFRICHTHSTKSVECIVFYHL